jgi:putative methanogenesis marker protein 8
MDFVNKRDIHVLKYFSSFVSVSNGKVIRVTRPSLTFCPLAEHLYKDFRGIRGNDKKAVKRAIKSAIESKIKDYGFFTDNRKLLCGDVSIPYGASEMLMFALRKGAIDAAVVVCEGAGTVITDTPEIVQGIGARMNSLLLTSPIKGIIEKLEQVGCKIIFEGALIDQFRGVYEAVKAGYKTIAVTVSGDSAEDFKALRSLKKEKGVKIISLAVCTTGIDKDKIAMICDYADLVWSCASFNARETIGPSAIIQLSTQIPVFVLTKNGVDFVSAYAKESRLIRSLNVKKQYLISNKNSGRCVHFGSFKTFISEAKLPINAMNAPR